MPFKSLRTLGGMLRDIIFREYPNNRYLDAENINLTPNRSNTRGGATVIKGSTFAFGLGEIQFESDSDDYIGYRVALNLTTPGIVHSFTIQTLGVINITSAAGSAAGRYADLISQLETATSSINGEVYVPAPVINLAQTVHAGFRMYGLAYTLTEQISSSDIQLQIIKPFYGTAGNGYFVPLADYNLGTNKFIISSNGPVTRYGVAQQDFFTKVWTYTVLLETNSFTYDRDTTIMDLPGEVQFGDRVAVYPTAEGYLPRTIYVKLQTSWEAFSAMVYNENPLYIETGNPDGYYIYDTIADETSAQLSENIAFVSIAAVQDSGGVLKAGGYYYLIRQLSGDEGKSPFFIHSSLVAVFSDPLTSPTLSGNAGGEQTSKAVQLTITGLNPNLYDKFELIAVVNTAGVISTYIVNDYNITGETMIVTHNGTEITTAITPGEISAQQIFFNSVGSAVIARNRLYYGNVTVISDVDLSAAAQTITITTKRVAIPSIGNDFSSVNEFMKPDNIFGNIGYMIEDSYRVGVVFKIRGRGITPSYFIKDHRLDDIGLIMNNDSTAETYQYCLEATIDFTLFPDIDGVPFIDLVEGYFFVRREAIAEVFPGYILPTTDNPAPYYTVGGQVHYFGNYTQNPTSDYRLECGWISLDNLFGTTGIDSILLGDIFYNYGQPNIYNVLTESSVDGANLSDFSLSEYNGITEQTKVDLAPSTTGFEAVPFGTNGNRVIRNFRLSTEVNRYFKCNQSMLAVGLDNGEHAVKRTSYNDRGFYYCPLFRQATSNKYGNIQDGLYQTTGAYHPIIPGTTSYTNEIWGGDTFTQKNFIKWTNQAITTITANLDTTAGIGIASGTYTYVVQTNTPFGILVSEGYQIILPDQGGGLYNESVFLNWAPIPGATSYVIYRLGLGPIVNIVYIGADTSFLDNGGGVLSPAPPTPIVFESWRGMISFYSQVRGNYQLRNFPASNSDNYPYTTTSLRSALADINNPGTYNYSNSYTPVGSNVPIVYTPFDPDAPTDVKQPNALYYSNPSVNNELSDPYREILPLNFKFYPGIYGAIRNLFLKDMNWLMILMDRQIISQTIDLQQAQTNVDGSSIIIGDGTVLGAREVNISNIGAPIKTGARQYRNSEGKIHMVWYEPFLKKLMRYKGGAMNDKQNDLGDSTGFQSFLSENNNLVLNEKSIIFGDDFQNDEILITTVNEIAGAIQWINQPYNQGDIVYTVNSVLQKEYFKARINVPADLITPIEPNLIANQLQYWQKYRQSNYTLVFNDDQNQFSSFSNYWPRLYMSFQDTFLTHELQTASPIDSIVFEHNKGILRYDDEEIIAYVNVLFNDQAEQYKIARIVFNEIDEQPVYMFVRNINITSAGIVQELKTYGIQADFKFVRPEWNIDVKNDATISGDNPTGINSAFTAQIAGNYPEVTIFFKNSDETSLNTLKNVLLSFIVKGPYKNVNTR